mmetsp:Transcript_3551/g.9795  ORF Transcript_3551/g.9795 Transcript_3551/m.9795 type:complete len:541 (-) Transcript_3551:2455-4077(-)|eukprot:CAMPEP_0168727810 /NCGR_PEP_ID=MMETSP0724-20121128/5364_1 /TAXON_ID=265536 /ORGANISM="Amphiprora sp., Strain CCMP467" /LENGTH=540 /DNA_ID=CAMNT_0008774643 /DNA_START=172 /DNA_END=1794 /DNA_ORIENTATION=+
MMMNIFTSATLYALFFSTTRTAVVSAVDFSPDGPPYDKCTKEEYYADLLAQSTNPLDWSKDDVMQLITDSHRRVLSDRHQDTLGLTNALATVWQGSTSNFVKVIYRDIDFPVLEGTGDLGWKRHHLWAYNRGWNDTSSPEAWTDLHGKAPADASVLRRKLNLWFNRCSQVEDGAKCRSPATVETADTSETDAKIFAPPNVYKGDVARALFYFAARYETDLGLRLVDCPPFNQSDFGYLSELLTWHTTVDPVSVEEEDRNLASCRDWQGNRNPFQDYPELVEVFYPDGADEIVPGTFTYSRCTAPTAAPTATPNPCREDLEAGDIPMFLVNSVNPDQVVFLPTKDLDPALGSLFLTDNPWDGAKFLTTEGTYEFEIPADGILTGTIFGFGDNSPFAENWDPYPDGGQLFDIQPDGDNLFLYCLDADNIPNILAGYTNVGQWVEPGLTAEQYGSNTSALPENLQDAGSIALPQFDNCIYDGPTGESVTQENIREFMITPENWRCQNGLRIVLDLSSSATMSGSWVTWTVTILVLAVSVPMWL